MPHAVRHVSFASNPHLCVCWFRWGASGIGDVLEAEVERWREVDVEEAFDYVF